MSLTSKALKIITPALSQKKEDTFKSFNEANITLTKIWKRHYKKNTHWYSKLTSLPIPWDTSLVVTIISSNNHNSNVSLKYSCNMFSVRTLRSGVLQGLKFYQGDTDVVFMLSLQFLDPGTSHISSPPSSTLNGSLLNFTFVIQVAGGLSKVTSLMTLMLIWFFSFPICFLGGKPLAKRLLWTGSNIISSEKSSLSFIGSYCCLLSASYIHLLLALSCYTVII